MSRELLVYVPGLIGVMLIALVHLSMPRLRFLGKPGSVWLDIFAGVALGYMFVDLLPHLGGMQAKLLIPGHSGPLGFIEYHAYLTAMAGFLFYLAVLIASERARSDAGGDEPAFSSFSIAAYVGAFSMAAYAFLVGYILAEQGEHGAGTGFAFAFAMATHFAGFDHFYRHLYPRFYDSGMRYLLATAVCAGWVLGVFGELTDLVYAMWFSFLAGGLMIVTVIFELPRIRTWRPYLGFCVGAVGFGALLLLAEALKA